MRRNLKQRIKLTIATAALVISAVIAPGQSEVAYAATSCDNVIAYPGTTTNAVNLRAKAGTKFRSYGIVAAKSSVKILGSCNNDRWYKVTAKVNGVNRTGYIYHGYVKKASSVKGTVNVSANSYLNLRKSASTSAASVAKLYKGLQVTATGFTGGWYALTTVSNGKTVSG